MRPLSPLESWAFLLAAMIIPVLPLIIWHLASVLRRDPTDGDDSR